MNILNEMVGELLDDINFCNKNLNSSDDFWKRAYVRNVFAFIEACTFGMKTVVAEACKTQSLEFQLEILPLLPLFCDYSVDINDKGEKFEQVKFIELTKNIRFAFKYYAWYCGIKDFNLDTGSNGWSNLKSAIKVRNRIVHPKNPQDLIISQEELLMTKSGFSWYIGNLKSCILAGIDKADRAIEEKRDAEVEQLIGGRGFDI